jgi:fructose/tagatose bisphosphate aldolase
MAIVPVVDMLAHAEQAGYALGYFESWSLDSLLAVADAAEAMHSPVLLGFSGLYLPHPDRAVADPLGAYAAMGLEVCRGLSVPVNLIFNESPREDLVRAAIELGFGLVMFSDERLQAGDQIKKVAEVVRAARPARVAVEGETVALPGIGGGLVDLPADFRLTDPRAGRDFVERTGVDTFAVNIGQAHLHGRRQVRLNLDRLRQLREAIPVPLVLHGASSVHPSDLGEAIRLGIRKINVGSCLKQAYFEALRRACGRVDAGYHPYEIIGSGLRSDVTVAGRIALQKTVEEFMHRFGSARRA